MSSSNEDELRKVWNLIDSHFDTALLTDADIEKIDEAIIAYATEAQQVAYKKGYIDGGIGVINE